MPDSHEHPPQPAPDSGNHYLVSLRMDNTLCIMNPPFRGNLTKDQALNLAAWLVAIADPAGDRFNEVLRAIRNT